MVLTPHLTDESRLTITREWERTLGYYDDLGDALDLVAGAASFTVARTFDDIATWFGERGIPVEAA